MIWQIYTDTMPPGDNFVHRLVQNKTDGKLVASEGAPGEDAACGGDKLDSAQLEFTYILTHQLDSQRMFYEEKINRLVVNTSFWSLIIG